MTTPAFEHRSSVRLPAPPDRIFRALTDASELERWFARHVRVQLRPGGAYRFWGSATLGAPDESEATQMITALERDRSLQFSWRLLGVDTTVTYRLEENTQGSELWIAHAVAGSLPFRRAHRAIDDLWRIHAGNLSDLVQDRAPVCLPDFQTGAPKVQSAVEIHAPPAEVWRALLLPEQIDRWTGGSARVELASHDYSYGWTYEIDGQGVSGGPTKILELLEHQKLVTDWPDWRGDPDKPNTRVTWSLEPLAAGKHTRLTVTHDGFEHAVDRSDYQQGWAGFLQAIAKLVSES